MNVYIDNLQQATTEAQVRRLFEGFGTVTSVVIVRVRPGGASCGYGFVEMQEPAEARTAITALNGSRLAGHVLKVDEA